MKYLQMLADQAAISFSILCVIHCLILPLFIVLLPNITMLEFISDESFHLWMLFLVIPISLFALGLGYRKHGRFYLIMYGVLGILIMMAAVFLAEPLLGEYWEKILTLIGACIVAYSHYQNYYLYCHQENCICPMHTDN